MYYFDLIPMPLAFRGYGEYAVVKAESKGWMWLNIITNVTMAMLQSETDDSFPIGRLTWKTKVKQGGTDNKGTWSEVDQSIAKLKYK